MLYELVNSREFADWQAELVVQIRESVDKVSANGGEELDFVQALVQAIIDAPPAVRSAGVPGFRIDVESMFLHGSRSQVTFSIGGQQQQRELADLLVLASYVEKNVLCWQRVCFVQAKLSKAIKARSSISFAVDRWQMELLRRFPQFCGVSGIFKGGSFKLRNSSGMLGAYALLTESGEFSISSARIVGAIVGGRGSFPLRELLPIIQAEAAARRNEPLSAPAPWWPFDPDRCPVCREIVERWFPWSLYRQHHKHPFSHPKIMTHFGDRSTLSCLGIEEFLMDWSALELGELWDPKGTAQRHNALAECVRWLVFRVTAEKRANGSFGKIAATVGLADWRFSRRSRKSGKRRT